MSAPFACPPLKRNEFRAPCLGVSPAAGPVSIPSGLSWPGAHLALYFSKGGAYCEGRQMTTNGMLALLGLSGGELMVLAIAILILFGAKKIPEFARGLGQGIKEFKRASREAPDKR